MRRPIERSCLTRQLLEFFLPGLRDTSVEPRVGMMARGTVRRLMVRRQEEREAEGEKSLGKKKKVGFPI
jgi:hypothetical protein